MTGKPTLKDQEATSLWTLVLRHKPVVPVGYWRGQAGAGRVGTRTHLTWRAGGVIHLSPWSENRVKPRRGPPFWDIDTWSSCQKNFFSTISYMCQNFIWHIVALAALAHFRIVTHSYAASFSLELVLC